MATIARIRGWNQTRVFWLFYVLSAAVSISIYLSADHISNDVNKYFLWLSTVYFRYGFISLAPITFRFFLLLIVLVLINGTGILSPLLILVLKRKYLEAPRKSAKPKPAPEEPKPVNIGQAPVKPQKKTADVFGHRFAFAKKPKAQVFVSYRRTDSADISGRIYDRLVTKFGRKAVFKDVDSIPLGIDFKEYLDQKVGECDALLAVIGDHWLDARDANGNRRLDDPADFVRIEIESALERDIPVIPLLVRNASVPTEGSLPVSLRKLIYRNGIPIRPDPDFHRDMDRLIAGLEKYVR
jgi:hypothetical protein